MDNTINIWFIAEREGEPGRLWLEVGQAGSNWAESLDSDWWQVLGERLELLLSDAKTGGAEVQGRTMVWGTIRQGIEGVQSSLRVVSGREAGVMMNRAREGESWIGGELKREQTGWCWERTCETWGGEEIREVLREYIGEEGGRGPERR